MGIGPGGELRQEVVLNRRLHSSLFVDIYSIVLRPAVVVTTLVCSISGDLIFDSC